MYFIEKLKIMLIVIEIILLCYFNIVIQSLGILGQGYICQQIEQDNNNKDIKALQSFYHFAVTTDEFTYYFSFISRMRCYVLNILLSTLPRTVFLQYCLVRYSVLAVDSGTILHQTTLQGNSTLRSRQQYNIGYGYGV